MPRRLLPVLLVLCLVGNQAGHAAGSAPPSPITASDLFKIKQLESPALSPDGRWVVYVVRSVESQTHPAAAPATGDEGRDRVYRTQLWLAATDGKTPPRPLTFGTAANADPVWSPQGDCIAFVRTVDREKPQIYVLAPAGGDAVPLTRLRTGATRPRWSPDGAQLVFVSPLSHAGVRDALERAGQPSAPAWNPEQPGRTANATANAGPGASPQEAGAAGSDKSAVEARPADAASPDADGTPAQRREWLARNAAEGNPRLVDRLNLPAAGDPEPVPVFARFYTVAARAGADPAPVPLGHGNFSSPEWLADGSGLVCLGPRRLDENPGRPRSAGICRIDLATGAATVLQAEPGCTYGEPIPSPDGRWIAFTLTPGGEYSFDQPEVAVVPAAGGKAVILTPDLDRAAANLRWAPDSAAVYFTTASRGHFPLSRVTVERPAVTTLTTAPDWGIDAFDVRSGELVQVVTEPGNPWELYAGAVDAKAPAVLTAHNRGWLKDRILSAYEPHRLVNKEGIMADFWTMKPARFDPTKKYPLLVEIHGGPAAMWGPGEPTMWHEFQYFAARGYSIVFCNPRGSGGYGRDFMRANFQDWAIGPASDVLSAASFAAEQPFVDRSRQVVTGGSYGGYLTAWIIGHDHRFKAAVAGGGFYDLTAFLGSGGAWRAIPMYYGGFPWQTDVRHLLERDSPVSCVENITTPLLLRDADPADRPGLGQSPFLCLSLRQLGQAVEYARYPHATHELSPSGDPRQRLDRLVRSDEFFRRYIGDR